MISFVLLYRAMDVFRFVKAAPAKRNGERLKLRRGSLCGVVENRGRINPATQPDAKRNVRNQMPSDCILHQDVKFFFSRFEGVSVRNSKRQTPIGAGGNLAVLPFQPIS